MQKKTSDQHCELRFARIKRDVKDLYIIHSWFIRKLTIHSQKKPNLGFISTGLTAP